MIRNIPIINTSSTSLLIYHLCMRLATAQEMEVMEMGHRDGDVMWANEMADGAEEK